MADDAEVERVARLMHAAYAEYGFTNGDWRFRSGSFEELAPDSRAAYRAVAAAVIADRAGAVSAPATVEKT